MSTDTWQSQVEDQLGRPLTPDEVVDASRAFTAMPPALRADSLYVIDFVQGQVRLFRDDDRNTKRFEREAHEMERRIQARVTYSADQVQNQIDKAIIVAMNRLEFSSPNMEKARLSVLRWLTLLMALSASLTAFSVLLAQKGNLIPCPGLSASDQQAMVIGKQLQQLDGVEKAFWAAATIPDLATAKELEPVVSALVKCRRSYGNRGLQAQCSRRFAK